MEIGRSDTDLTGILSSIRQSKKGEGKSVGVGPNICLSPIFLSPLVGDGGVEIFSSRDITGEGVALSSSWDISFITNMS